MREKQKKMNKEINLKRKKGITLIALVITIIVLLILAGVTIATLTGDNGLLQKAGEAKSATEIAEEKDIISTSAIQAQSENRYGNLEESNFSEALNTNSKTGNKANIIASDIGSFTVKFESNRYYEVNKNGNISYIENATGEKTLTIQCVNSKNEVLGEYEYTIVTDRYSKLPPTINKYESSDEKIEGEITGDKTIQVLYNLICNDSTTLVFTGLDTNGNITENENEIVNYMVGDGSNTGGNGLKEKTIQSVLVIPDTYNGKPITKVGSRSFQAANNIIKIIVGDNVTSLNWCFNNMSKIDSIVLGKKLVEIEGHSFWNNSVKKVTLRCEKIPYWYQAFQGCTNFKEVILDGNEELYKVEDNIVYSKDGKTLIFCPSGRNGEFTIPQTVEKIEKWAFASGNITSIYIGDNINSLPERCFNSSSIENIYIGENVKSFGALTFNNCNKLVTVTIDSSSIASILTSGKNSAFLLNHVNIIYIKEDIEDYLATYIKENYNRDTNVESEEYKAGYVRYVKLSS